LLWRGKLSFYLFLLLAFNLRIACARENIEILIINNDVWITELSSSPYFPSSWIFFLSFSYPLLKGTVAPD
jgi:CRISPR/Cas system CSM-associated protein Csm3 (group 7 of RAMP superfamily)